MIKVAGRQLHGHRSVHVLTALTGRVARRNTTLDGVHMRLKTTTLAYRHADRSGVRAHATTPTLIRTARRRLRNTLRDGTSQIARLAANPHARTITVTLQTSTRAHNVLRVQKTGAKILPTLLRVRTRSGQRRSQVHGQPNTTLLVLLTTHATGALAVPVVVKQTIHRVHIATPSAQITPIVIQLHNLQRTTLREIRSTQLQTLTSIRHVLVQHQLHITATNHHHRINLGADRAHVTLRRAAQVRLRHGIALHVHAIPHLPRHGQITPAVHRKTQTLWLRTRTKVRHRHRTTERRIPS